MENRSGYPAVPLFTHDPYFSVWDVAPIPTAGDPHHWAGREMPFRFGVAVDGREMRFFGRSGSKPMKFTSVEVTPLSALYRFEDAGVTLEAKFTSPLLLDDLEILSTPISFLELSVDSADGKAHDVRITVKAPSQMVASGDTVPQLRTDTFFDGGLSVGYMGQVHQAILAGSGDHVTIDWGYLFFASADGEVTDRSTSYDRTLRFTMESKTPVRGTLLVGYDDIASLQYFGRPLKAYYARNGKTITEALRSFHARKDEILRRCRETDEALLKEAGALGGEAYQRIVTAAYRLSIAAHKLAVDENGDLLFISKENDSNGCAATVDVSYPSVPLYLLKRPELVRGMMRPIFRFAKMPVWTYDFAPHDAGRYPILDGQVYGSLKRKDSHDRGHTPAPLYYYPASENVFSFEKQMPVEESANMLLMLAAAGKADGDFSLAEENLELLRQWCEYLLKYGEDPGNQLCTDDFAGHLARNVNLSAKAIMGVAAFGEILKALRHEEEAAVYFEKAKTMAASWVTRATAPEGHTYLTFDKEGWSQKYNVVWDKLFGWNLLPESFYEQEIASYLGRFNAYGLPLDSRADYTKSDWTMWVASLAKDRQTFDAFTKPMALFLAESPVRVPFGDWYDTVTGCPECFIARSVQGGVFMPLLMKKWAKEQ